MKKSKTSELEKLQALRSKANKERKGYWNQKIDNHFFGNK
jgi:hypothetical protein